MKRGTDDKDNKKLKPAALENILIGAYDDSVKENAEIRAEAGLTETITREAIGGCCDWCSKLEGTYKYGEEPKEVYKKHDNCTCVVTAKTDKGYTDVWSKEQYRNQIEARNARAKAIEEGQNEIKVKSNNAKKLEIIAIGKNIVDKISRVNTGGHSVGKILEYYKIDVNVEEVIDAARKGKRHAGTYNDAIKKTEGQLKRSIESHNGEVSEHAEKIKHPELYDSGWSEKTEKEKNGLIKKWKKDMKRNAEQAYIEAVVYAERFK